MPALYADHLPAPERQQKAKEHAPIRVAWAQNGPKKELSA